MSKIEWRPVRGFEGLYEVSNAGQVKSLERVVLYTGCRGGAGMRVNPERILAASPDSRGYPRVNIGRDGNIKTVHVHILVCQAFHVKPDGKNLQVAHNDGDRSNPSASNLRWATPKENNADRVLHGTMVFGNRNGRAKLIPAQIAEIRGSSLSYGKLAATFGMSKSQIGNIKRGQSWRSYRL